MTTRVCPYCKERVRLEAVRCSHCNAALIPGKPTHKGTCPYCKERIKRDAIKCKHCGSLVGPGATYLTSGDAANSHCCADVKQKFTISDVTGSPPAGSQEFAIEGMTARAQYGCGPCEVSGGLIYIRSLVYAAGKRNCWIRVPIKISPTGVITYKEITWTEDCQGPLLNDPWA